MKKSLIAALSACMFVFALAGCSSGQQADEATTDAPSSDTATEETAADTSASGESVPTLNASLPIGGLVINTDMVEPDEMDEAEVDKALRSIRAYTPSEEESLIVNNAESFYFYDQLSADEQAVYDVLLELVHEPTAEEQYFAVPLQSGAAEEDVSLICTTALWAMLYDHPELFWLYNGIEDDVFMGMDDENLYLCLEDTYDEYETQMTAFNDAVDEFLSDIDVSASDAEIALQIHDKLIDTVHYDYDVAEAGTAKDLAHTAYGALVANSEGEANCAVCDGYAQAYLYLLQQAGVDASIVVGDAGSSPSDAGGHAWSIVKLDDSWYEVDSTWNDGGAWQEVVEEARQEDPENAAIPYYEEALADTAYFDSIEHYLFNVTTDEITDYSPDASYDYTFDDGAVLSLVTPSVHYRAENVDDYGIDAILMALAPVAEGTTYTYESLT